MKETSKQEFKFRNVTIKRLGLKPEIAFRQARALRELAAWRDEDVIITLRGEWYTTQANLAVPPKHKARIDIFSSSTFEIYRLGAWASVRPGAGATVDVVAKVPREIVGT